MNDPHRSQYVLDTKLKPVKRAQVSVKRARRAATDLTSAANIVHLYTNNDALVRLLNATANDIMFEASAVEIELADALARRKRENI